jgi:hypothetical protein
MAGSHQENNSCHGSAVLRQLPGELRDDIQPGAVLGALELGRYVFDLAKFGREASYHMWSSKAWGIVLFVAFFGLLVFGYRGGLRCNASLRGDCRRC